MVFNLSTDSRAWINQHLPELRKKYPNKTVLVCEGKIIKTIDKLLNPIEINKIARKLCPPGKDWSYTYVAEQEEEYIL